MKKGTLNNYFKFEFNEWVKKWIEKNKNVELESGGNYLIYIQQINETQQECFDMFYELTEIFFQEWHSKLETALFPGE